VERAKAEMLQRLKEEQEKEAMAQQYVHDRFFYLSIREKGS
jgi:hypothetical protein